MLIWIQISLKVDKYGRPAKRIVRPVDELNSSCFIFLLGELTGWNFIDHKFEEEIYKRSKNVST